MKTYEVQIHLKNCGVVTFEREWDKSETEFLTQLFSAADYTFHKCVKTNRHFAVCTAEITGVIMEEKPVEKEEALIDQIEDDGW
jgi:hypothetical protein